MFETRMNYEALSPQQKERLKEMVRVKTPTACILFDIPVHRSEIPLVEKYIKQDNFRVFQESVDRTKNNSRKYSKEKKVWL
jgi:ubiquinone/menaquinone biosynthesis C-methylase UbiE